MMNYCCISLGSNLKNPQENVLKAMDIISELKELEIVLSSRLYASAPWGFDSQNEFVNACCVIKTSLSPDGLLRALQCIEKQLGRTSKTEEGYTDRLIDLDIVFYNHLVMSSETLQIPHGLMHVRNFVLEPLAEIAPDWVHPVYLKTVMELLTQSKDPNQVHAL